MKNIMFFCIPAHGHHNPTLPVVRELVKRGNKVRYYSFDEFKDKIIKTGAEYISCNEFMPDISESQVNAMKKVSTTEMTIVDLRITIKMDSFLKTEVENFKPDVIVSDSVCFWGKLTARKYNIPIVVSTTTFAFNKFSSKYRKDSKEEIMDVMKGTKRVNAELKKLNEYGYNEKSIMPLVQNDNYTDTIVYATEKFQPCSETFSKHYAFVGTSVLSEILPDKKKERPLVYISFGTVMNENHDFYDKCIKALGGKDIDVIISCGNVFDIGSLGNIPSNIEIKPYVNQLEILSKADVFVTHCGMNSVSESIYMATPMVLFPQTSEQRAVAKRAEELGTGIIMKDDSDIYKAVEEILNNKKFAESTSECSNNFRSAKGYAGAADFIENAPHTMPEYDKKISVREKLPVIVLIIYWCIAIAIIILVTAVTPVKWWILAIAFNVLSIPFRKWSDRLGLPIRDN